MVNLPYLMRGLHKCNYHDKKAIKPFIENTTLAYFTCHDAYEGDDFYANCKGRESSCKPATR